MKVIRSIFGEKKVEVKNGDLIHMKAIESKTLDCGRELFIQIISINPTHYGLLDVETGVVLHVKHSLLSPLEAYEYLSNNWKAFKIIDIIDGKKCEIMLPND